LTKDEFLKELSGRLGKKIKKVFEKSPKRIYVTIEPADITDVVRFVFKNMGARFNTASCVDMPNNMEILYHFTLEEIPAIISFRTMLDKKKLEIDSLTTIFKGAEWIEREIHELFGVDFRNHPNLKKLLLPDDWPDNLYPLRRDYKEEDYEARMKEKGTQ
jgi:NADH:ubiquinone oxidoreductase subunit C